MFENREFVINMRKKRTPSTEEAPKKEIDIVAIVDEIGSHVVVGLIIVAGAVTALATAGAVIVNATNPANR